jgi:hypothetical protein
MSCIISFSTLATGSSNALVALYAFSWSLLEQDRCAGIDHGQSARKQTGQFQGCKMNGVVVSVS